MYYICARKYLSSQPLECLLGWCVGEKPFLRSLITFIPTAGYFLSLGESVVAEAAEYSVSPVLACMVCNSEHCQGGALSLDMYLIGQVQTYSLGTLTLGT